ncbi:MAG: hypothetical protein IT284_01040 [Bacteroidetes bacterium]|nr:hypothetical protein [Bacteroidota bacterium]
MKIIEVSPISSKVAKDTLTYFSSKDVFVGDIVSIGVRKQTYDALVVAVYDLQNKKMDVKASNFSLKKIKGLKGPAPFYKEFFEACHAIQKFFLGNLGQIINHFLPSFFLEKYEELPKLKKRISGKSVLHIGPTIQYADNLFKNTKEKNTFLIHNKIPKKKLLKTYLDILNSEEPVTIVTTPSFIFIPRHDLGQLIIHDEGNSAYRTIKRPYLDMRVFFKKFAEITNLKIIFENPETLETITDQKTSYLKIPKIKIVDMSKKELRHKNSFIFSEISFEKIKSSDFTLLFSLKKGFGNTIVCHDCGKQIKDGDVALALKFKGDERILFNPHTGETFDTKRRCEDCGSWNFDTLGIGTDTIFEEAKKLFPKKEIFQIDSNSIKTKKQIENQIQKFYERKNSILIATELVLPYLEQKIDFCAVVSIDALFSLPSFRVSEKILRLVRTITDKSNDSLIQTRNPQNGIIKSLAKGELTEFFEIEKEMRKRFSYPPFGTIIRLSRISKKDDFKTHVSPFLERLSDIKPSVRYLKRGKLFESIIVFKISKADWSENTQKDSLFGVLSSLGADWQARVNPDVL